MSTWTLTGNRVFSSFVSIEHELLISLQKIIHLYLDRKVKKLISGLDFADSVIQSTHSYINTMKGRLCKESNFEVIP